MQLGRAKSTISRELQRNRCVLRGYRPKQAQRLADQRREDKVACRIPDETWLLVNRLLYDDWSPEQISGWLAKEKNLRLSHERIYQHVYQDKRHGGTLHRHLRCQKMRRKRYGSTDRRGCIRDSVCIDCRPKIVEERSRIGDWEVDTVIRPGGAVLVTLSERKSGFSVIAIAPNKQAENVTKAIIDSLLPYADRVYTLTCDNGKEFAYHKEISRQLQADCFFAHPYRSWERGLNENTNGLIRQYLPKGTDFNSLEQQRVSSIMEKLNSRPRKTLGFKNPNQLFFGDNSKVALGS